MTWAHFQQLRSAAKGRIDKRMGELAPRGGRGVMVNGRVITMEPPRRPQEPVREKPLLEVAVFAKMTVWWRQETYEVREGEFELGCVTQRESGQLLTSYFWESVLMHELRPKDRPVHSRGFELELRTVSVEPGPWPQPLTLQSGVFRRPVRLVVEEYEYDMLTGAPMDPMGRIGTVRKVHTFTIGQAGFKRKFEAEVPNQFLYLRPVEILPVG
ncbi:hypothetical protein EI77_04697 [Prosthecobacter fusiformis]|uniref:DUF4166 domain-containing protein n=1 Tax=Prosthecobacter fusiformis TaxID=48464 RepID=A0A4V3FDX5_9BACT|nr:hypothetical protein [Prosthecobacter fusiformis]TDU62474.1 hypothetical protein EI77_04697 [Prosthecobacter fusiformis]